MNQATHINAHSLHTPPTWLNSFIKIHTSVTEKLTKCGRSCNVHESEKIPASTSSAFAPVVFVSTIQADTTLCILVGSGQYVSTIKRILNNSSPTEYSTCSKSLHLFVFTLTFCFPWLSTRKRPPTPLTNTIVIYNQTFPVMVIAHK